MQRFGAGFGRGLRNHLCLLCHLMGCETLSLGFTRSGVSRRMNRFLAAAERFLRKFSALAAHPASCGSDGASLDSGRRKNQSGENAKCQEAEPGCQGAVIDRTAQPIPTMSPCHLRLMTNVFHFLRAPFAKA
jgi:hypothetical protein